MPENETNLAYKKKDAFERWDDAKRAEARKYCEGYAAALDSAKTEREAVEWAIARLTAQGFRPYYFGEKIAAGGKYYFNNRNKSLYAFTIGTEDVECGVRIIAAHIDSPRLDLKQLPLYEDNSLAYFKTHYYGGIRKYQWTAIPLALHGVVILADGSSVTVKLGDEPGDPVFCITDLLPHLAQEQNKKTLGESFSGETLNVLIASDKAADGDEKVKANVLALLNEKYGITEDDFISAELCLVPAQNAVDVGLDRSMIGAYGHDDFVCAYPALTALEEGSGEHTVICVLADKEETGSDGATGMQCRLLVDIIDEIARAFAKNANVIRQNSMCLSADVNAAFDPNYPDVFEKRNSALLGAGIAMSKYTGSRGKYSTNDATAEQVGYIRRVFDDADVMWQSAELGKVDAGGGGTVAKYISKENISTIDMGVPVLSMHAPFEIVSKYDVYSAHTAYLAFVNAGTGETNPELLYIRGYYDNETGRSGETLQ